MKVFRFMALLNFLLVVGTCGGIERNTISFLPGALLSLVFLALMVLFCKLGGLFYERR